MGRKIPGKKHRGVKDPYQQQLNRLALVKDKINSKPADLDAQPISESLHTMIQWQQMIQGGEKRKRRKKPKTLVDSRRLDEKEETLRGMNRPDKPVPAFIQHTGESTRSFLKRIDQMCEEVVKEAEFKDKLKIDRHTNAETEEEVQVTRKEKASVEEIINAKGRQKKKKVQNEEVPRLSKKERVKLLIAGKKQAKLDKIQEKLEETNRFRDVVAFGDIVHAPPVLTIPKRNQAKKAIESKPGRRGLLLQQMLQGGEQVRPNKPISGDKNRKRKMRDLPLADQERQERNRMIAVEAYRKLKKQKMSG